MSRLIGVGVGPGDPELLTVKAVRLLQTADLVIVPVADEPPAEPRPGFARGAAPDRQRVPGQHTVPDQQTVPIGRAEATVRAHLPTGPIERVPLAMTDRGGLTPRRERAWDAAARVVLDHLQRGAELIVFATIGDPNVYSTFGYLAETVRDHRPDLVIETVPGITAMQELASRSGTVLCAGREPLTLIPLTAGLETYAAALAGPGTVVAYKAWRQMDGVLEALRRHGRTDAVIGSGLGLPGAWIGRADQLSGPLPYLSTVLAPARRDRRGGHL